LPKFPLWEKNGNEDARDCKKKKKGVPGYDKVSVKGKSGRD